LIPFLEARFSPRITGVLAREAGIARDDEECLQRQAIDLADSIVLSVRPGEHGEVGKVEIDARALGALHPALGARVARLALEKCAAGRFVNFDHTHRLLELASRGTGRGTVSLPGQRAVRQGDRLVLSRTQFSPFSNSFRVSLSIPGEVVLEAQGWAVSAGVQTERTTGIAGADRPCTFERLSVAVASAPLELPLGIRSRSRGDRFKPLGMGGRSKKLQDYLVDRKIERELRDSLPLVVDARDRIVWVVGEAVDEDFRVTGPSQAVIFLKARRLGGQG
jgi:tRNA(Ile)-lysidine synthase